MKLSMQKELITAAFLLIMLSNGHAQTTINVNAGQTLTEADLTSGIFEGMAFLLDANTTFEINDGGTFDRVGESVYPFTPFDFNGSVVNVNSGGIFGDGRGGPPSSVSNVTLNLYDEGTILRSFGSGSGANVNVFSGTVDSGFRAFEGSTNNIYGGSFEDFVQLLAGSVTNIEGGQFFLSIWI